ncbi:MAG: glycerol-3-phosphate dehydrogenase/oxidase, partial [Dehalococcoidia bacterium]
MGLEHFNKACRPYIFRQLSSQEFDILIIGGGITGASIFRDAVLRGLRTALIEAQDFASGTSSRSSKLVHGGLRYLRHLHFNLVRESCRELNLHLKLNGRLVQPVRFLMPVYRNGSSSPTKMRVAMWLYDAMSGFKSPRPHQFINREDVLTMAPGITSDGLSGGCLYYEAIVSDNRLTLETVKDGVRHGGTAINHAPVVGLIKFDGQTSGVKCRDKLTGRSHSIRANVVINATGVFADRLRRLDGSDVPDLLTLSKGTHLVFAESDIPIKESIVFFSHIDGRALFLIKHEGCFLYGTTDDWEDANPAFPTPSTEDVDYLLESLRRFM